MGDRARIANRNEPVFSSEQVPVFLARELPLNPAVLVGVAVAARLGVSVGEVGDDSVAFGAQIRLQGVVFAPRHLHSKGGRGCGAKR